MAASPDPVVVGIFDVELAMRHGQPWTDEIGSDWARGSEGKRSMRTLLLLLCSDAMDIWTETTIFPHLPLQAARQLSTTASPYLTAPLSRPSPLFSPFAHNHLLFSSL